MSIIPTLPGCGAPAVRRIEIYSPAGGRLHGSLDASAYACAAHASVIIDAIHAAGLTAYVCTAPMAPVPPCGHVYAYPTAEIRSAVTDLGDPAAGNSGPGGPLPSTTPAAAADIPHPVWCLRNACAEVHEHRSQPYAANPGGDELLAVHASLIQLIDRGIPSPTMLAVTFTGSPLDVEERVIELGQGRALSRVLARLTALAGGDR